MLSMKPAVMTVRPVPDIFPKLPEPSSFIPYDAHMSMSSIMEKVNEMAKTGNSNPGNFANDPAKASEAGKKGGQSSGQGSGGSGKGSGGNFANDPQKASEAGKKGGQSSGGGNRKS